MKNILTLILILIFHSVIAQQDEGAIKTKNGFLLYFNSGANSHTLNLEGDIDISKFPYIKQNTVWFQFATASCADFGKDSKSILTNYMKWEINYYQKDLKSELKYSSVFLTKNGLNANFWKFINPIDLEDKNIMPIKTTYILDLLHEDLLYRLSYASTNGNDTEAKDILFNIVDNLRFYDKNIDLDRLQKNIIQGKNYYEN